MRILIKVLLFPVTLLLTVVVAISRLITVRCAMLLNIVSGILFLGALACLISYLTGWPFSKPGLAIDWQTALIAGVFSFLLCPYGLPRLVLRIVDGLDSLNGLIKSI